MLVDAHSELISQCGGSLTADNEAFTAHSKNYALGLHSVMFGCGFVLVVLPITFRVISQAVGVIYMIALLLVKQLSWWCHNMGTLSTLLAFVWGTSTGH